MSNGASNRSRIAFNALANRLSILTASFFEKWGRIITPRFWRDAGFQQDHEAANEHAASASLKPGRDRKRAKSSRSVRQVPGAQAFKDHDRNPGIKVGLQLIKWQGSTQDGFA